MGSEREKLELLKKHGFKFDFKRELYFNRDLKKVFSTEAIEDNNIQWLRAKIGEHNTEMKIYFNVPEDRNIYFELKRYFHL